MRTRKNQQLFFAAPSQLSYRWRQWLNELKFKLLICIFLKSDAERSTDWLDGDICELGLLRPLCLEKNYCADPHHVLWKQPKKLTFLKLLQRMVRVLVWCVINSNCFTLGATIWARLVSMNPTLFPHKVFLNAGIYTSTLSLIAFWNFRISPRKKLPSEERRKNISNFFNAFLKLICHRNSTLRYTEPAISNVHCRLYQDEDSHKKDPKTALVFLEDQRYEDTSSSESEFDSKEFTAKTAPLSTVLASARESA